MQHVPVDHVGERSKAAVRVIRGANGSACGPVGGRARQRSAAVRVIGETGDVLVGIVGAEVIEQKKRIEMAQRRRTDGAVDRDAGPFCYWRGLDQAFDLFSTHVK